MELPSPLPLVHVERLTLFGTAADVVQLEVRVGVDPDCAGGVRLQPGCRKNVVVRQIHFQIASLARSEVPRWVVGIWLDVDPTLLVERQPGNVAGRAADAIEG